MWHIQHYPAQRHMHSGVGTAMPDTSAAEESITPIFVSVQQAAQMLAISPWSCYQLLNEGKIESRYQGRRRSVLLTSLREYAEGLPSEREVAGESA
jgi:hypothetical protein